MDQVTFNELWKELGDIKDKVVEKQNHHSAQVSIDAFSILIMELIQKEVDD